MATDCIAQLRFKGDGFRKPVVAAFDVEHALLDQPIDGSTFKTKTLILAPRSSSCTTPATTYVIAVIMRGREGGSSESVPRTASRRHHHRYSTPRLPTSPPLSDDRRSALPTSSP